jgi:hypothetical protein
VSKFILKPLFLKQGSQSMKIIGAGFSRTGTFSLKQAIQALGFEPCYHGDVIFQRPDHVEVWRKVLQKPPDWQLLFSGYQAGLDSPICFFWREIRATFPDAKVILTKRDPDEWYESLKASLYQAMMNPERAPKEIQGALKMAKSIVLDHVFDGRFEDRNYAIEVYNEHNKSVEASFTNDPSSLLIFEVSKGWGPLCDFLDKEIPKIAFPNTNSREQFQASLE